MRGYFILMLLLLVVVVGVGVYIVVRMPDSRLVQARVTLENTVPGTPERYLQRVFSEAVKFTKGRRKLDGPYFIGGIVYGDANANLIVLHLLWLENGFQTKGFCVTSQRDGESCTVRLPILNGVDYRSQQNVPGTALREYEFDVKLGTEWGVLEDVHGPNNGIADARSFLDPVLFSVYDSHGRESNRVELWVHPKTRSFLGSRADGNIPASKDD